MIVDSDESKPKSNPTGGCSLGCAGVFVVIGLLFPILHMLSGTWEGGEMMLLPVFLGFPAFVVGHILAVAAICNNSTSVKRAGKRALAIMWCSIALVVMIAIVGSFYE